MYSKPKINLVKQFCKGMVMGVVVSSVMLATIHAIGCIS